VKLGEEKEEESETKREETETQKTERDFLIILNPPSKTSIRNTEAWFILSTTGSQN
jgi:hypothetical protein